MMNYKLMELVDFSFTWAFRLLHRPPYSYYNHILNLNFKNVVVASPPPLVMGWEGASAGAGGQEGH